MFRIEKDIQDKSNLWSLNDSGNLEFSYKDEILAQYQNLFKTDGILFIDMNNYDIIEVSFTIPKTMKAEYKYFLSGVFVGICLMVFIFSYF